MLITKNYSIGLMVEGIVGFSDMLSIAQTIGIVGTMVLTLFFSKKQLQSLSIHDQTFENFVNSEVMGARSQ